MKNTTPYFYIFCMCLGCISMACHTPSHEGEEASTAEASIDSAHDAWFGCYINQEKWGKSDELSATFSPKLNTLFLNLDIKYSSVTYKNIHLQIFVGKDTTHINRQLTQVVGDTLLATILYSFAEIDYSADVPMPVNHIAFELKPTALVCLTKVDTVKHTMNGTFRGFAEDETHQKHRFQQGVFKNIGYNLSTLARN